MGITVKICGLTDAAALAASLEGGAEYAGFVFYPRSPRALSAEEAARLLATLSPAAPIRTVGLFVRPRMEEIAAVLARVRLDILQLYETSAEERAAIRKRFGLPIWQAVGVAAAGDLPPSLEAADALLLDAKPPPGADRPGGLARAFPWGILAGWSPPGPWILAGGLTPENVAEAISRSGARAVDVSSGVESAPGRKDPARIRRFIAAVRKAEGEGG